MTKVSLVAIVAMDRFCVRRLVVWPTVIVMFVVNAITVAMVMVTTRFGTRRHRPRGGGGRREGGR